MKINNPSRNEDAIGTMSGFVRDEAERVFGISCAHVVKGNPDDWTQLIEGESTHIFTEGVPFGKIKYPYMWEIDTALILLDSDDVPTEKILTKENILTLEEKHQTSKLPIFIDSIVQGKKVFGNIVNYTINSAVTITFSEGKANAMTNLFSFNNENAPITVAGDSGAWIKTVDGEKVIGMVVGATKTRSYGVKMTTIFEKFNLI